MPLWSLTYERVLDILKQRQNKTQEIEVLKNTPEKDIWDKDLVNFQKCLDEVEKVEEEERNTANNLKGKRGRGKSNNTAAKKKKKGGDDAEEVEVVTKKEKKAGGGGDGRKKKDKEPTTTIILEDDHVISNKENTTVGLNQKVADPDLLPLKDKLKYKCKLQI